MAPARKRASLWRLVMCLAIISIVGLGLLIVALGVAIEMSPPALSDALTELELTDQRVKAFFLATFIAYWLGLWIGLRLLHKRALGTLFGRSGTGPGRDFLVGLAIPILFGIPMVGLCFALGYPIEIAPDLESWTRYLLPIIVLVFIQVGAEEAVFRGYILQQLAARWKSPVVWAVIPSILFGLLHVAPDKPALYSALYVASAAAIGLLACALVYRTGTLWAAIGLHFGINVPALQLFGNSIDPLGQLVVFQITDFVPLFLIDLGTTVLILAFVMSPYFPRPVRSY